MSRIKAALVIDGNYKTIENSGLVGTTYAITYDASLSSASDITLNASTTAIEVSAIDKGVFLRYQATASSSLFDEFIPANTTKIFDVNGIAVISILEQASSAAVVVIEK